MSIYKYLGVQGVAASRANGIAGQVTRPRKRKEKVDTVHLPFTSFCNTRKGRKLVKYLKKQIEIEPYTKEEEIFRTKAEH
jgi:hypothetical protein